MPAEDDGMQLEQITLSEIKRTNLNSLVKQINTRLLPIYMSPVKKIIKATLLTETQPLLFIIKMSITTGRLYQTKIFLF